MEDRHILSVKKLNKAFGGIQAVSNISFDLKQGEFLGIIGPNGSGKSTLVNLISGFIKPTSGKIYYRGRDITGKRPDSIVNLGIARTFQMAKAYYEFPAYKNIVIPLCSPRVKGFRGGIYGERDDVAIDLLEEVGFERDSAVPLKITGSLPHGYLKRLELARCIALRADIIILDELFSGMSMAEVAGTMPIIEKLKVEGKTIIMIEHRLKELFRVVNSLVVLNYGEIIAQGQPKAVMETEAVKKAYLGFEE